ncbi:MAG: Mpv17/PMP22 family protein, partial [Planctomycetota bacterium]
TVQNAGLTRLGDWKLAVGWPFAVVSTALFGGALPWAVQRLRARYRAQTRWTHLFFLCVLWGWKGFEIDLLYRGLGWLLGEQPSVGVVALKVLIDMGPWVILWAVPTTVLGYDWKDAGFSAARMRREGKWPRPLGAWYRRRVVPVLISNWAVWTPAVCVIYCLPLALQLPVQNLVLLFWSLMLVLMVGGAEEEPDSVRVVLSEG